MDLEVKASGRSKTLYGLEWSSDFWLQRAFLCMCSVLPNSFFRQGFASLCPCQDYYLDVYKRQRLATYSVSVVTSISESKQGAGCKFLNWNPPICCLRKCREEAGCEFSTWNPSISHLTGSLNSENKNEIRIFLNTIYKNKLQIR